VSIRRFAGQRRIDKYRRPSGQPKYLAEFGQSVTQAFNKNIRSVYGGAALRPLGTMAFIEAAACFLPAARAVAPSALFQLTVVKQASAFKLETFLDGKAPMKSDIVIEERLALIQ